MTDPTSPSHDRSDPVVTRVNELATTALDTAVAVAFAVGAWFSADHLFPPGVSWAAAGAVLFGFSQLAQWRSRPRAPKPPTVGQLAVPGPAHPGNLHVSGR